MTSPVLGAGQSVIAFDVGGTDMKAALVDASGALLGARRVATPVSSDGSADAVLAEITRLSALLHADHPEVQPQAGGLVVPGLVDDDAGLGVYSENLGWRDVPFRERAERILEMPVFFGHDVRAAGEAEFRLGAARGYRDVIVVIIGTGIAGAIYVNGQPYVAGGYAGEIGHSIVELDGPACACGGHGCLEAIASAGAIARRYTELSGTTVNGAKEVLVRAQAGDRMASGIWDRAIDALALSLSQTVAILAPEAVVIGGGLAQSGAALFEPLTRELDARLTFQRRPVLVPANIGEDAGLIGAALRARDQIADRDPIADGGQS